MLDHSSNAFALAQGCHKIDLHLSFSLRFSLSFPFLVSLRAPLLGSSLRFHVSPVSACSCCCPCQWCCRVSACRLCAACCVWCGARCSHCFWLCVCGALCCVPCRSRAVALLMLCCRCAAKTSWPKPRLHCLRAVEIVFSIMISITPVMKESFSSGCQHEMNVFYHDSPP